MSRFGALNAKLQSVKHVAVFLGHPVGQDWLKSGNLIGQLPFSEAG